MSKHLSPKYIVSAFLCLSIYGWSIAGNMLTLKGAATAGDLTKDRDGTVTLKVTNTYAGTTTITAGTLQMGAISVMPSAGPVVVSASGTFALNSFSQTIGDFSGSGATTLGTAALTATSTNPTTYSGAISGSGGSLVKAGASTLTLTGTDTYSGGTTINAGTLKVSLGGILSSTGAVNVNSATSVFDISALTAGGLTIGDLSGASAASSVLLGAKTLTCGTAADSTFAGIIGGVGGSLVKQGAGIFTLSGVNTYNAGTSMSAGTLNINADAALGSGGTALNVTGSSTLQLAASIGAMARTMPITAGQTLTVDTNGFNLTNSGIISGVTGSVTKISTGILTLSGTNTYGSGTTLNAGTLNINADAALGTGGTNLNVTGDSTLQLAASVGAMARAMPITAGKTLTVDTNGFNLTNSGAISGVTGALTKISAGTLTLSGPNTYGSGTTLNAGTININADAALGSGGTNLNVTGSSTLQLAASIGSMARAMPITAGQTLTVDTNGFNVTNSGAISGLTGAVTKISTGILTLSGTNTYGSGTTINAGTLRAGAVNTMPTTGAVNVAAGTFDLNNFSQTIGDFSGAVGGITTLGTAALTATSTNLTTYSGTISGSGGSLVKAGASTLTISGVNKTYTGGMTINAGTLQMGAANVMPTTGAVNVAAGTFDLNNFNQAIGDFSGAGTTTLGTAALTIAQTTDLTYSGTFTSGLLGSIAKNGAAQLQLTGNSPSFIGTCTINAGEIKLNGALGTAGSGSGNVTVTAGSLLSGNATIGGALINSGTVAPGNSVGTMNVGSLFLNPGSLVEVEINDAMQNDIFSVSPGTATVDGTLDVTFLPGVYVPFLTYTIVNAPAGRFGTFSSVLDNAPDMNIQVLYFPTTVILTITGIDGSLFFGLPLTGNALSVANNISAINQAGTFTTDPDLFNAIFSLVGASFATVNDALLRLDPTPYTSLGATTGLISASLAEFYAGKKRKSCCPSRMNCEDGNWSVWADPFMMHFDQHAIKTQDGFDATVSGVALGVERGLTKEWKVGFGGAYDHLAIDWDHHRGNSKCDNFYGSIFADREARKNHFSFVLLGGLDTIANQRDIRFTTVNEQARSNYHAGELVGQASGAIFLGRPKKRLDFYATVTSDTLFQPAFKEHGAGGLSLNVNSQISSVLISEAGMVLRLRRETPFCCWGPDFWIAYVNETFLTSGKMRSTFVNQVIPFSTVGIHRSQNLCEMGISITCIKNDRFTFSGTYSPQIGAHLFTQRGDLRLRYMF